jgi:hypothetical protein
MLGNDQFSQDQHYAIKLLGGKQTLVLQNFISGWQLQKSGSGIELTSAVSFAFQKTYTALFISFSNKKKRLIFILFQIISQIPRYKCLFPKRQSIIFNFLILSFITTFFSKTS